MLAVFWVAVGLIGYTYVGFPVLLALLAVARPRPHAEAEITPAVTIVVAAHNEAEVIGDKIGNLQALDYPDRQLEIIVVSDGSTDGTVPRAREAAGSRVRVLDLPRVGKAVALNRAAAVATGDILVFSDANSMFAPGALRALVAPFADPSVGAVAGDQRYTRPARATDIAVAEEQYWSLDRLLKVAGSRAGNATSATGAIHAIRRELYDTVPDGVTDDFFISTGAIVRGHRLVFAREAATFEPVSASASAEFDRKVRVVTRGLVSVLTRRQLLAPWRHGTYALQLWSHKVLRRLVAFPLVVCLVVSLAGASGSDLLAAAAVLQVAFYALAAAGALLTLRGHRVGVLRLPTYFCLVNIAAMVALARVATGRTAVQWEPMRGPLAPSASGTEEADVIG